MKKLLLVLFAIILIACSAVNVFAAEADGVSAEGTADGEVEQLEIEFNPARFVENLSRMGIGMIGIFIVMGVVIIITYGLNKATGKKK